MSSRFKVLKRETERLRKQFLPIPFDPLGVYPNSVNVQAHCRAFLVLSHAEFESYFEGWAKDIARASEELWNRSSRVSNPLAFLLSASEYRLVPPKKMPSSGAKDSPQKLSEVIKNLFQEYYKLIKDNNGIKEHNVLALFGPIGIASAAFNATLLPNLDAMGSRRGTWAHNSVSAVTSVLDPETEYKHVGNLLVDLGAFDSWLTNHRKRIR